MRLRYFLLLIFLVLALGPLLLFRAWPHSEVLQGELDEVRERHLLLAQNIAAALERYHRDLVTTFELFAISTEPWVNTEATERVLENLDFRHLCLADAVTGRVLDSLATVAAPCPEVVPADTLERLTDIAETDVVNFGSVVGLPSGENVMHLVTRRGNRIVIGAISTAYFRELGEAISFGVMGHAAIVDHTGRALSHPRPDWTAARQDMSKISAVQRMLNRETGVEIFYSPALDGDMIAGFTFVDPVGWGAMIPQPLAELYQRADDARRSTLVVLLIGTSMALALAIFVSLRVVRPIELVSRASAEISKGTLIDLAAPGKSRFLPIELTTLQSRFRDMVTRLRENVRTINGLAFADPVTGLGNRTVIQRCLEGAVQRKVAGAFVLLDLDGFKAVNDDFGHDVGDKVLELVAYRIKALIGEGALTDEVLEGLENAKSFDGSEVQIARMGGDEFAVWMPHASADAAQVLADKIVKTMRDPFPVDGANARIGVSVGIALLPTDASDRTGLMKAADLALYDAKNAGRDRHTLYTPSLREALNARRQMAAELEVALERGEICPYFQPQFSLSDLEVTGVEALVRWHHPRLGCLEPLDFLPTAQEMGRLERIDEIVLEQSVQLISDTIASGLSVKSLAVNISEDRLKSPTFLEAMERLADLPFEIRFELLETLALDRIEGRLAWTLDRIRELGHKVDLDDFGAANASVLGLMNVEPAHLKIDRKLVEGISQSNVAERLVRSVIEMGHSLDTPIIAEGVENATTLHCLQKLQCDYAQGFVLAKPMDIEELRGFLRTYRPLDAAAQLKMAH